MAIPLKEDMSTETLNFSADVSRLLDIVANALYTNHDVFLRELISNAADACDRLRYEAIQNPALTKNDPDFKIRIAKDTKTRTLTMTDNGIGMSREELIENLGTIAKSGSAALMEKVKESKDSPKLIGQFGVGFYASYWWQTKSLWSAAAPAKIKPGLGNPTAAPDSASAKHPKKKMQSFETNAARQLFCISRTKAQNS